MSDADRGRRELTGSVLLCLAGSALTLACAGRTWAVAAVAGRAPLPDATVSLAGGDLAPGVQALALVGLAGVVAVPATRRLGRLAVGLLLLLAGLGVVASGLRVLADVPAAARATGRLATGPASVTATAAPALAAAGGLLLALAGVVVAARGPRWAALSRRYDAPAARAEEPPARSELAARSEPPARPELAAWEALDRGEDPTRS